MPFQERVKQRMCRANSALEILTQIQDGCGSRQFGGTLSRLKQLLQYEQRDGGAEQDQHYSRDEDDCALTSATAAGLPFQGKLRFENRE